MFFQISQISDFFQNIEKKYDLFSIKIENIYFWKIVRVHLYDTITNELNIYNELDNTNKPNNILHNITNQAKKFFIDIQFNAKFCVKKADVIIFQSPRKQQINNDEVDIYTKYYIDKYINSDCKVTLYDLTYINDKYHKETSSKIAYPLGNYFSSRYYKFNNRKRYRCPSDNNILSKIENEIKNYFNININVQKIVNSKLAKFIREYQYYYDIFKKSEAKKVYIVCSYGLEALISAAHSNSIYVIEIQHGVMSNYHLGYSFPKDIYIPYFPDEILMFGEFWKESTQLPLSICKYTIVGYQYFNENNKGQSKENWIKNRVLFISQWTLFDQMFKIAIEFAKSNTDCEVIYKLHPREYRNWKNKYSQMVQCDNIKNFKVADGSLNFYELAVSSEYQVGVYSTAIYEGLALGLKTILLKLPGIVHMSYLIENGFVAVAKDENEIRKQFNYSFKEVSRDYFFKSNISYLIDCEN